MGALRLFSLAVAASLALTTKPAPAQISAEIPANCGDHGESAELTREIRDRLPASAREERVAVTIAPDATGYRLEVVARGQKRELHDRECAALTRAAVVVSLALVAPEMQTSSTPAGPGPRSAPPPKKPADYRIAIAAEGGAQFGTTPKPAFMLGLDAQLSWERFGLALGLRYSFPTTELDSSNHGVRASALGATFAGTFTPWSLLQARAGLATYRLAGQGRGSVDGTRDSAWDFGPLLGVQFLPFARPPFWTAVAAEGQLSLVRAHFSIHEADGNHEVFRVSALSAATFLRAGLVW